MAGRKAINEAARRLLGRDLTHAEVLEVSQRSDAMGIRDEDVSLYFLLCLIDQRAALLRASRQGTRSTDPRAFIRRHWRVIAGLVVAFAASNALSGWTAASSAYDRGFVARAKLVEIENAWLMTPAGQAARSIHDGGQAIYLANCAFPGWKPIEHACQPGVDPSTGRIWRFATRAPATP